MAQALGIRKQHAVALEVPHRREVVTAVDLVHGGAERTRRARPVAEVQPEFRRRLDASLTQRPAAEAVTIEQRGIW